MERSTIRRGSGRIRLLSCSPSVPSYLWKGNDMNNRHGCLFFVFWTIALTVFGFAYAALFNHFREISSDHANFNFGQFGILLLMLLLLVGVGLASLIALRKTRGERERKYLRASAFVIAALGVMLLLALDVIETPWVAIKTLAVLTVWLALPMLYAFVIVWRRLTDD